MSFENVPNKYYGHALLNLDMVISRNKSYINLKGELIEYRGSKTTIPEGSITHNIIIGDGPIFVGLDCDMNFFIYNGHTLKFTNKEKDVKKIKYNRYGQKIFKKTENGIFKINHLRNTREFETVIKGCEITIKRMFFGRYFKQEYILPEGLYAEMKQSDGKIWNGYVNNIYDWKGNLCKKHFDLFHNHFKAYMCVKEINKSNIPFKEAI